MNTHSETGSDAPRDIFVTTRWTLVLSAGRSPSPQSEEALAELCRIYWRPLYVYVRRRGHGREDAEDLTQAFLGGFLGSGSLQGVREERGRFRAYLLASLKHFLSNARDRSQRQKRGGGVQHLSLDWTDAEGRVGLEPAAQVEPEAGFDREWALSVLERVVGRLESECSADGKAGLFTEIRRFLMMGSSSVPYRESAVRLGLSEGNLRVAVHRLRKRFRVLLREEVAGTLADPADVDEELRALLAALSG